jgi:hypothetical protein
MKVGVRRGAALEEYYFNYGTFSASNNIQLFFLGVL